MKRKSKLIEVTFIPQAWMNDYAVQVECEGPDRIKVPASVLKRMDPDDFSSDELRQRRGVPKWIKDWSGPFYFTWDVGQESWRSSKNKKRP